MFSLAENADDEDDDDVPDLVENFDEACKDEIVSPSKKDEGDEPKSEEKSPAKGEKEKSEPSSPVKEEKEE